jgi:hypothetical protein
MIEGWEGILQFIAQLINKDTSESAYGFSAEKKKRLIAQATKVSRKRNWVMPVEAMFLGTLVPASAGIIIKASTRRKEYMAKKREDEINNTEPELNKGGPNKGFEKRRGPGRPRK